MKKFRRILLVALVAVLLAGPTMSTPPASATEVCLAGKVLDVDLPGCNNCPPGISVGPSGVHPFVSVFVCVRP